MGSQTVELVDAGFGDIAALAEGQPEEPEAPRPAPKWQNRDALLKYARECKARKLAEEFLVTCRSKLATLATKCSGRATAELGTESGRLVHETCTTLVPRAQTLSGIQEKCAMHGDWPVSADDRRLLHYDCAQGS